MKLARDSSEYIKSWPLMLRCIGYFKPHWGKVLGGMISMSVVAACTGAAAFLVQPALDDIFIRKDEQALMLIPLIYVLLILVKGTAQYLQNYLMKWAGLQVLETLRNELHTKMVFLPIKFFEDNQVGMLMSRIINDVLLIRMSLPAAVMVIRQIMTMIGAYGRGVLPRLASGPLGRAGAARGHLPVFLFRAESCANTDAATRASWRTFPPCCRKPFPASAWSRPFAAEQREGAQFTKENNRLVGIALKEVIFSELSSRIMELIGAVPEWPSSSGTAGTKLSTASLRPALFFPLSRPC